MYVTDTESFCVCREHVTGNVSKYVGRFICLYLRVYQNLSLHGAPFGRSRRHKGVGLKTDAADTGISVGS